MVSEREESVVTLHLAIWAVCLGQCVSSMLVVSEREEGVEALHLAIWAVCLGQ